MSSSITMPADSTQSEPDKKTSRKRRKEKESSCKRVKKAKKTDTKKKKPVGSDDSDSGHDSDLDLDKELKPIGGYIREREQMVLHMFHSISNKKLRAMLPELLKPLSLDDLKCLCLEQLEGMSKKRIRHILDGADPGEISSSGTEDEESPDEDLLPEADPNDIDGVPLDLGDIDGVPMMEGAVEGATADSTLSPDSRDSSPEWSSRETSEAGDSDQYIDEDDDIDVEVIDNEEKVKLDIEPGNDGVSWEDWQKELRENEGDDREEDVEIILKDGEEEGEIIEEVVEKRSLDDGDLEMLGKENSIENIDTDREKYTDIVLKEQIKKEGKVCKKVDVDETETKTDQNEQKEIKKEKFIKENVKTSNKEKETEESVKKDQDELENTSDKNKQTEGCVHDQKLVVKQVGSVMTGVQENITNEISKEPNNEPEQDSINRCNKDDKPENIEIIEISDKAEVREIGNKREKKNTICVEKTKKTDKAKSLQIKDKHEDEITEKSQREKEKKEITKKAKRSQSPRSEIKEQKAELCMIQNTQKSQKISVSKEEKLVMKKEREKIGDTEEKRKCAEEESTFGLVVEVDQTEVDDLCKMSPAPSPPLRALGREGGRGNQTTQPPEKQIPTTGKSKEEKGLQRNKSKVGRILQSSGTIEVDLEQVDQVVADIVASVNVQDRPLTQPTPAKAGKPILKQVVVKQAEAASSSMTEAETPSGRKIVIKKTSPLERLGKQHGPEQDPGGQRVIRRRSDPGSAELPLEGATIPARTVVTRHVSEPAESHRTTIGRDVAAAEGRKVVMRTVASAASPAAAGVDVPKAPASSQRVVAGPGHRVVLKATHSTAQRAVTSTQPAPTVQAQRASSSTTQVRRASQVTSTAGMPRTASHGRTVLTKVVKKRATVAPQQPQSSSSQAGEERDEGCGALSYNQMEILELEMRARAIKAMLHRGEVPPDTPPGKEPRKK